MNAKLPVVIVGGGLAGALAAVRLAQRRPDLPLLLIEAGSAIGGNHTWSFFDSDVPAGARDLIAALNPVHWPRHSVRFQGRARDFEAPYNAFRAEALDRLVRATLTPQQLRFGALVERLEAGTVVLSGGERIAARAVIDARGPQGDVPALELGWQKFVGIEFAAKVPDPQRAMVMDATMPQLDGYRFVYVLPMAADRVLVEDTYYADGPELDVEVVSERVRALAAERGIAGAELRRESGVLPILIGGDPQAFWPASDPVARLGLAGGFFHATTGYSLRLALLLADELANLPGPLDGPQLAAWSRGRFLQHWSDMGFFRMLNRMLFRAAEPAKSYRVLEHFYRLPPVIVAHFYAARLTMLDKARILSGRPPVPIGRAIAALLGRPV